MRNIISAVLLCALAAACSATPNPVAPSPASITVSHAAHAHEAAPLTEDFRAADLAAVRRATAAFHDPAVAAAAGYLFNEPCHASAAGAMGIHAPNPALLRDGVIDALQPEILLYIPDGDGTLRLVGVEYMQPVSVRDAGGVVSVWRLPSKWPATYEVVTPTPQLFGQVFQGPMAGHTPTMPWHWDLHVWVWAHNPNGTFAQWNPALTCA